MKENLVKISGGLAVMFSIFLLLATAKQFSNKDAISTRLVNPPVRETATEQKSALNAPVAKGTFNINTPGNVVQSYDQAEKIFYHYKALTSAKLKDGGVKPILRLEIETNGKTAWKETQWSWIDYNQGILYFHFKTVENGVEKMIDNYTGKYQLAFE